MFQCKDVAEEASNYLERDLPIKKRLGLFLHLLVCSCCRNYLQQLRHTITTVATLRPTEDNPTDTKALAEKLRTLSESKSR
jgi:mRNA-degrading endonuclease toxin of MazEF toxin-antitoxin module